jgi:hypothetical protein
MNPWVKLLFSVSSQVILRGAKIGVWLGGLAASVDSPVKALDLFPGAVSDVYPSRCSPNRWLGSAAYLSDGRLAQAGIKESIHHVFKLHSSLQYV